MYLALDVGIDVGIAVGIDVGLDDGIDVGLDDSIAVGLEVGLDEDESRHIGAEPQSRRRRTSDSEGAREGLAQRRNSFGYLAECREARIEK